MQNMKQNGIKVDSLFNKKNTDYTRTAFEAGKIYSTTSGYGLAGAYDRWFLDAELDCVEILSRDGDTLDVRVHSNYHPSVAFSETVRTLVGVRRDVDGCEYFSVAFNVFFPKTEISREYMTACEDKFSAYCREWHTRRGA